MAAGSLVQGALFTVMVVRAGQLRDPGFEHELARQIERSPRFFRNAPVVLDLKGTDGFAAAAEFDAARQALRDYTLILAGVQNAAPAPPPPKSLLVTQPVRSGTQIYARGGDLVVTAAVSPGAELIADGNIHVYGALRGRALAGASGEAGARIFCSRLEAELVSIAGRYLVSDQLPAAERGAPVQIALVDDRLTITRI